MVEDDRRLGDAVVVVVVTAAAANAASLLKDEQRRRTDPVSIDRGRDFTKRGDFFRTTSAVAIALDAVWGWIDRSGSSGSVQERLHHAHASLVVVRRLRRSGRPAGLGRRRAASSTCARVTRQ